MIEKNKKAYFEASVQIVLLILATISFSYLAHESDLNVVSLQNSNHISIASSLLLMLKIVNKVIWNEKTIVSALDYPTATCVNAKDGRTCVEYSSDTCAANCNGNCLPALAVDVDECKIGTCYDSVGGTCAAGSMKKTCQSTGGTWLDDPNGNAPQCKKGCCFIQNGAKFVTDGECGRTSDILGITKNFKPEINTELACLIGSSSDKEGACVLNKDPVTQKNSCKFTTKSSCGSLKGSFFPGILCSNPELNTNCEKQKTTSCVANKAEIYWIDSCGNKENIYSADKIKSWNDGKVLDKQDSCSLSVGGNALANQGTCGNCDYLAGSACGAKSGSDRLDDATQNVACKDLSCVDENGIKRAHGESWCAYQGAVGVVGDNQRSVDTPGSRDFREVCLYGTVRTEPCADYRNEICVENKAQSNGKEFSTSACRINLGKQCLAYNTDDDKVAAMQECSDNPDCFVKEVKVSAAFKFNTCAPKYAPGFDLVQHSDTAAQTCALASQSCTIGFVKKITSGGIHWKCAQNCECLSPKFAQEMNDLCISLGDCGASANYVGTLSTGGYRVSGGTPKLSSSYLSDLSQYSDDNSANSIPVGNITNLLGALGIPSSEDLNLKDPTGGGIGTVLAVSGASGAIFFAAAHFGIAGGIAALGTVTPAAQGFVLDTPAITGPTAAGGVGVIAGTAVGIAATYYLIKFSGIAPGISPSLMYTLIAAGGASGGLLATSLTSITSSLAVPVFGWGIASIVVTAVVVLKLAGVGGTKKKTVSFTCNAWQPPRGGADCTKCGKDGFPCSQYSCQSLGGTCRFVNEGTKEERCVDVSPNDVSAPIISPLSSALPSGYIFGTQTELGVQLKSTDGDGCIGAFTPIKIGILLDKPGRCRYSTTPLKPKNGDSFIYSPDGELTDDQFANSLASYEENDFSAGIIKENHTAIITLPSAESLGLAEYDPSKRADFNVYVRCENANGYESARDYVVNFCVKPGKDITPPIISISTPATGFAIAGTTKQNLKIFTNEPADCSWSLGDKDYSLMENKMNCENDIADQKVFGWGCNATLPVTKDETNYYIRCADKPWENDTSLRNKNSESKILDLKRTSKLEITSAGPIGENLTFGTSTSSVKITAETSGGMSSGATCTASFDGKDYFITLIPNAGGTSHERVLQSFTSGNKKVWLKCTDEIGNTAYKNISFNVLMDNDPPSITRVYYNAGKLIIKTNENADCALSQDSCNFNFENGTLMSGSALEHSYDVDLNKVYYAKCKDSYDNIKGACDRTIKVV